MSRFIKDFLQGMVMTFYRMVGLVSIPTGIYMLCILHTSSSVWLGIAGFLMAIFFIVIGVVVTWLFGWYDRILDEENTKMKERLKENGYENI